MLIVVYASAQNDTVSSFATLTGKITDDNGQALDYATVKLMQGESLIMGTTTGTDGMYSLNVKSGTYTLIVSYVGCKSFETKNLTLHADTVCIQNVVLSCGEVMLGVAITSMPGKSVRGNRPGKTMYVVDGVKSRRRTYYQPIEENTEEYTKNLENRFIMAMDEPLSTFSADVDAASYGNMRRFINKGEKPPVDAIRTEELINYFSYDYPQPQGENPVSVTTEVGNCPWNNQHKLVRIGIKAKEISSEKLPASNFVFLIDVSGSMYSYDKLELVKSSLKLLVNNLRDEDRVSIVVYAGAAGEVLPSTSGADKQKIKDVLETLEAGGSTAGGAGIQLAYKIAKKNFIENGNNRVILCTDGDFNVGISDIAGLESLIETERKSGIFLTVLGYGMGNYKDNRMQTLAQKGNGNHAYIDNLQEANKVLINEFGSTMYVVAKDVKLQIEFNPAKVQAYRLVGYESRLLDKEDFNDDTKDAGEMGAGHTVTAFYEVVPVGVEFNLLPKVDSLKYQKNLKSKSNTLTDSPELMTVKLRYKLPAANESNKMEIPVVDTKADKLSDDFRFAAAVAMFGQLLRNSDFKGNATYEAVISLAESALGKDKQGYRREFIRLVQVVKNMD
ncbi:MAG: von Willebrand factor type A domain-containing protein [Bacteroidales bacterium]|nr:von Willebrand factor type A domain-containing protein [Bacteroidales bacterium]